MACLETDATDLDALPGIDSALAGAVALTTAWADPYRQARPELPQSLAQAHPRWVRLAHQGHLGSTALVAAGDHALH